MGWLSKLNVFASARSRAQSLYEAGMKKAKKEDYAGAIQDYTKALAASDAPPDLRAMLLFNRGLAYSITKDESKANQDLEAVVSMQGAPAKVVAASREKLGRIRMRSRSPEQDK